VLASLRSPDPNPTPRFRPSPASVVNAESFYNGSGPLQWVPQWGFTDNELCDCGETQTMSHIVMQLLSTDQVRRWILRLHEADEAAVNGVNWLTTMAPIPSIQQQQQLRSPTLDFGPLDANAWRHPW